MTDVAAILELHRQRMPEALIAAECLTSLQRVRTVIAEHGSSIPHPRKTRPPSPPRGRVKLAGACLPKKRAPAIPPDPFGLAILPHLPRLFRYALSLTRNRSLADDLVQDVFARALTKQHLFQPGTDLSAWLMTMLHHWHAAKRQDAKKRAEHLSAIAEMTQRATAAPQEHAVLWREVVAALDDLPVERRAILLMAADDIPRNDIAAQLGIPHGTVLSRLARGRDALHELLDSDGSRHRLRKPPAAPPIERAA